MPKKVHHALTVAKIRSLPEGTHADGEGLALRVSKRSRRWVHAYRVNGQRRNVSIGAYPLVSLSEARQLAQDNLRLARQGIDPLEERHRRIEEASRPPVPTFEEAAEKVIDLRRPTWSSDRHATQWSESLRLHAYPIIGYKAVNEVTPADALEVLTPIWTEKPETARRVRQRMETIFDWTIASGFRSDNPASAIRRALPRNTNGKQHHPALPYDAVPDAVQAIQESTGDLVTRLSFEFVILTAARAGEVRGMTWDEVDFDGKVWTVSATRMKMRRPHRVPLSDRAVEILHEAKALGDSDLVFPNKRTGKPLSNMAFSTLLKRLDIPAVPHGFRASFRSWCLEQTDAPWAVAEAALAHTLGDSVASAYIRADLFNRRRALMAQWGAFVSPTR